MRLKQFIRFLEENLCEDQDEDVTHEMIYVVEKYHDNIGSLKGKIREKAKGGYFCVMDVAQVYATDALGYFVGTACEFVEESFGGETLRQVQRLPESHFVFDCFEEDEKYFISPSEQQKIKDELIREAKMREDAYLEAYKNIEDTFNAVNSILKQAEEELGIKIDVHINHGVPSCYLEVSTENGKEYRIRVSDHQITSRLHKEPDLNIGFDAFHDKKVRIADFGFNRQKSILGDILSSLECALDINLGKYICNA